MRRKVCGTLLAVAGAAGIALAAAAAAQGPTVVPPPANAGFDYQIGGGYPLPPGVTMVSRDWFSGDPAPDPNYSICYVNAFQTQANEPGTDRPDEQGNWPRKLVLTKLGDDPKWGGEYLIDIRSERKRKKAARWVQPMLEECAAKGYEAVEFDNLDSWTRFDGTPLAEKVPFGKGQALAYAAVLSDRSHALGLAVGQKNTADVTRGQAERTGFDFAIAEQCARYNECDAYTRVHGDRVIEVEYSRRHFEDACDELGDRISIVLRDRLVSTPGKSRYVFDSC
jgi:hypothetical protein